jgi:hypothetical protein
MRYTNEEMCGILLLVAGSVVALPLKVTEADPRFPFLLS